MTARVADVLPSGDLVVEGVREIGINGDRQMVGSAGGGPRVGQRGLEENGLAANRDVRLD